MTNLPDLPEEELQAVGHAVELIETNRIGKASNALPGLARGEIGLEAMSSKKLRDFKPRLCFIFIAMATELLSIA